MSPKHTPDGPDALAIDSIYERMKEQAASADGSGKPSTVNYADPVDPTGNPVTLILDQEYVYGLNGTCP